jgi:YVTN family beta-propeller protein
MAPLPVRASRACAALAHRVSFRVLCPRLLPRAVVGWPGLAPPSLVATLVRRAPNDYTGIDFSYGAPWESPGWRKHRWRNRPCCFLHFVIERLEGAVPTAARAAVLGGHPGRLLPASSVVTYGGLYFANHVRFFFHDRGVDYVATLHTFGNRETTALLGRIVSTLHAAPFRRKASGLLLHGPEALAPSSGDVWTTSIDPGRLLLVDPSGQIARTLRVRLTPLDIAVTGRTAWVTGYHHDFSAVRRVDLATGRILATIRTGSFPRAAAADRHGLWIVNSAPFYRRGNAVRIDPATRRITARVALGRAPTRIALDRTSVWITDILDGTLTRIDRASARVLARIRVGGSPYAVVRAAGSVWVTNSDDGTVSRVDPRSNRVVATIRVGRNPYGIAATPGAIFVANLGSGTVSRIDPSTDRATTWARVGADPFAIAASGRYVWVTINGEGTLIRRRLDR